MSTACCPFCDHAISLELERWGGHCPSCLADIHGQDAATDPGVGAVVAAQAERARRTNRRVFAATLLATSVVCIGIVPLAGLAIYGTPSSGDLRVDLGHDTLTEFDYDWATDDASLEAEVAAAHEDSGQRDTGAPENLRQASSLPWAVGRVEVVGEDVDLSGASAPTGASAMRTTQASRSREVIGIEGVGELGDDPPSLDLSLDVFAKERGALAAEHQRRERLGKMSVSARLNQAGTFDRAAARCLGKVPAEGEFQVGFRVDVEGVLRDVVVTHEGAPNERMERCIRGAMEGYRTGAQLDAPQEGTYGFWF